MLARPHVDSHPLREKARSEGLPLCDYLITLMRDHDKAQNSLTTLLAACPNSEAVIKASLRSAKRNRAPIKFAATLNQVDIDGGYTGMDQFQFVETIKMEAEAIDFQGPIIIAVDHGGPWLKDIQASENWPLEKAMEWVKKSLEAAVEAGYDLLHVDPTVDRTLPKGSVIPIDLVVERTVQLIAHTEAFRRRKNYPPISYEVGTEEVHGGLADLSVFDRFLQELKKGLQQSNLDDVWPILVVGKVGTDLHTSSFDPKVAGELVRRAARFGSFIKGHYTDYVENPGDYPRTGMGGANVGPEFTEEEYFSLAELEELEKKLHKERSVPRLSGITEKLEHAVQESNRWKKWLQDDERDISFFDLKPSRRAWLTRTGCRYVWTHPAVVAARWLLYQNLERNGYLAEEMVLSRIERSMDRYFRSFGLVDITPRLEDSF